MRRRSFARPSRFARYIPFGLFGGQISGAALLVCAFLLMLVSGVRPGLFDPMRRGVTSFLAPTLSTFSTPFAHISETFEYFYMLTQLKVEAEKLRVENARLEEWYNTAQLLMAENQSLRGLLHVGVDPALTFVTARVIGDTSGPYMQTVLIGAGSLDGISKGDTVLGGQGVVGRIASVQERIATVLLLTDLNSRVPVRVGDTSIQAILSGLNGAGLLLDRLPDETRLEEGIRIMTSGVGGVFPPDLPVGVTRNGPDGRTYVTSYADFGRLVFVRVIRNPNQEMTLLPPTQDNEKNADPNAEQGKKKETP